MEFAGTMIPKLRKQVRAGLAAAKRDLFKLEEHQPEPVRSRALLH
jgi:hypothetical protein